MKSIVELRAERATLINENRALVDLAEKEKREFTSEESKAFDARLKDGEALRGKYEAMERQAEAERSIAETAAEAAEDTRGATELGTDQEKRLAVFEAYLRRDIKGLSAEEYRALQADIDVSGGFSVPQQMVATLIKFKDDMLFVRQHANVVPVTTGDSLGAVSLDADPEDGTWTAEIGDADEDTQMAFGGRELDPHQLTKLLKVSQKLIRTSALDITTLVPERLAYKFGVTEEKNFLTGDGAGKPLGVFTASASGISTGRDVSTGNTSTAIAADGLIEAKYNQKGQYWALMRWLFHRDALKNIQKLKDGEGQYIWQPGLQGGQPDLLLNMPFDMSEFAPNTFTASQYVGILADWSQYMIAELQGFTLQVLMELYATTGQVGYLAREWVDGMPVLEEAFTRVKLAA